tara:strand:- start:7179 stop:7649 length:471 start_codon:yes stop_codon:yes gene_type:complete
MIVLTFNGGLPNDSLKVGDIIYYIKNPNQSAKIIKQGEQNYNFGSGDNSSGVATHIMIGQLAKISITKVEDPTTLEQYQAPYNFKLIIKTTPSYLGQVSVGNGLDVNGGDYIFFAKNNLVEQSSISGYYNTIKLENDSVKRAELFAVSCGVVESSK